MKNKNKKFIKLCLVIFFILILTKYHYDQSFKSNISKEKKVDNKKEFFNPFQSKSIDINNTWDSGAHDYCKDVTTDSFGNIYLVGSTDISGNNDIIIVKYNSSGHYQWNSTCGGSNNEFGYGIEIDSSNNIYVIGYTNSYGNGQDDIFFLKYNVSGGLKWNKTWGGINFDFGFGITIDIFDDIYISGIYNYSIPDSGVMCLIKFSSSGIEQWNQTWDGISSDCAYDVAIDSSNNIYLGGVTNFGGLTSGFSDVCLVKYDSSGVYQWNRTVDYNNEDVIFSIVIDSFDNIYLGGYTDSFGAGSYDMLLIKYNNSGGLQWNESWGGILEDKCNDIAIDSFNNVYITGYTKSYGVENTESLCLIKYDKTGGQLWNWSLEAWRQITGEGLKIDLSNNIYISGEDTGDMFLIKFLLKPGSFDLSSDAEDFDTDGIFNLNWTKSDDAQNYSIYQYNNFITVINNSLTPVLEETADLSLPLSGYSNGIYYFIVEAHNEYENTTSNCIQITIQIPQSPGSFVLTSDAEDPDTDGMFNLNWTESDDAHNYSIYRYDNFITVINNSLTPVLEETTSLSLPLSGYSNGIYYFIAVAHNEYGNTTSNCIQITIQISQGIPNDNNFIIMLIVIFSISGIAIVGTIIIITRKIQRK